MSSTLTKAVTAATAVLCASTPAAAQWSFDKLKSPEWRLYTSPDQTFAADVPCALERRNVSADARPLYEYNCGTGFDSDLVFFVVQVSESSTTVSSASVEDVLNSLVQPLKQMVETSTLADGVSREAVIRNTRDSSDNMRVRVSADGPRCYIAAVVSMDIQSLKSPAAERFFSSFKPLSPK